MLASPKLSPQLPLRRNYSGKRSLALLKFRNIHENLREFLLFRVDWEAAVYKRE